MRAYLSYILLLLIQLIIIGCGVRQPAQGLHFTPVDPDVSHIDFNNRITESDSINVFTNEYMYNGSGVGIGDFNNDGLQDLFFAGSMVSCKLYLNKGNFQFDDISTKSGIQTSRWCTGVTVVDINSDGFDDIYVSVSHAKNATLRTNYLFINDGKLHFTDQAAAYGLSDTSSSTQAAFLDYDKDGDLDMYLLNHRLYSHTANNLQPKDTSGTSPAQDKLYRNDGTPKGASHPVFSDVTLLAGIKEDGYGLGIVVSDVNHDHWPDIYVANDYIANDVLWLNNGNGTFSNAIGSAIRHQSYNSMGVDAADINNDLRPDLASLDMLPETNNRKKMMLNATNQEKYDMQQRLGYEPSFMRNMLQLNNGNRTYNGKESPYFSEIGQLAGVFETDWSWSVLMADFDNDGWKDMHITNGLAKDVTNNDYASFRNSEAQFSSNYTFGAGATQKPLDRSTVAALRKEIDVYGSIKMNNYLLRNNGDLTFSAITETAGIAIPSISNGAAYADLDNDGDLDLIVNNMNQEAFLWKNDLRSASNDTTHHFLTIQLKGPQGNPAALGARVTLFTGEQVQMLEQQNVRGFSSSVDLRLHVGLGKHSMVDSLLVEWPDDRTQMLRQLPVDQILILQHANATDASCWQFSKPIAKPLLQDVTGTLGIQFKHSEVQNFDFGVHQPLMQRYSQLGPCIATGDMNGDGLEDFFVGGAANQSGKIMLQTAFGTFVAKALVSGQKQEEDLGAILFDGDNDNDLDLLITGGSFEFVGGRANQPRYYVNDGKAHFTLDPSALPEISDVTHAVAVADIDGDHYLDVFIGGRISTQQYPRSPRSYLLKNQHGKFIDATSTIAPLLMKPGMIDAALFTDFNGDHQSDLIVAGEWTSIRFFANKNNHLEEVTSTTRLANMHGFWRSLQEADVDGDGDFDFIAGNLGLNNKYHVRADMPLMMHVRDLDKNGVDELVPSYAMKNNQGLWERFPGIDRNQLAEQVPAIKKKYLLHSDFAKVTMKKFLSDVGKEDWFELKAERLESMWIENKGNGIFQQHVLPMPVQFAPVNAILATDVNGDEKIDIVLAGNEYQTAAQTGRYDASYGNLLLGDGRGNFTIVEGNQSGWILDGDVKDVKIVHAINGQRYVLASPNNSALKLFSINTFIRK